MARRVPIALPALLLVVAFGAVPASAQTKVTYLLTAPAPDVAQAPHSSVPAALGFWKESGLDVEVQPTSGSSAAVQLVIAGTADCTMATIEPLIIGRQQGARIVAVYNHVREPIYTIAVPAESGITRLADLKGKTIGAVSLSSGAVPFAKAMLRSEGLDPEKDVNWVPIGQGAQAIHAVRSGQIDALAYWDWAYAILENAGLRFRHFTSDATREILSLVLICNEGFLEARPEAATKLAQGIAKATLFTITNPEAAVRIHWETYPTSKPAGLAEDRALAEASNVLKARSAKYRIDGRAVPQWGAFRPEEWVKTQDFLVESGMVQRKLDVKAYYTDRLVSQVNAFDKAKIVEQAKAYR